MKTQLIFLLGLFLPLVLTQQVHEFHWTLSTILANPDGVKERPVIAVNGEFPLPVIKIKRKDRVVITVVNQLEESTSLHFHGIFQEGSTYMDGASMISQCPIPSGEQFTYDFVVGSQSGTYWYHSHDSAQYGDGLRGAFIVEDADEDEDKVEYDDDFVIMLSDWYHTPSSLLVDALLSPSGGSEPGIDGALFNETHDFKFHVEPSRTYYLRLINAGMSASQYFYVEDHELTIVEIDGVKVMPVVVDSVKLATGQRYGVLLRTKDSTKKNYGVVQMTNIMMHKKTDIGWMIYNSDLTLKDRDPFIPINANDLKYVDDFTLVPKGSISRLGKPDHEISFTYDSKRFGNKVLYYTMNGKPHLSPRVPTLNTLFSADESTVLNPLIYGQAPNAFLIQKGEIVQIVVNSQDHMRHPFHLHGHNFQVVSKAKGRHFTYDESLEGEFPEYPLIRDTMEVPARGYIVLRFTADNPGVWFFHCHTEWHAVKGLGVVFIESADEVLQNQKLPEEFYQICEAGGIPSKGNAAGNKDLFNLEGEVLLDGYDYDTSSQSSQHKYTTTTENEAITTATQVHKGKQHHATPASTQSSDSADDGKEAAVSLKTQTMVLIIYFAIMCSISGVIALYVHRSTKKAKKSDPLIGDYD